MKIIVKLLRKVNNAKFMLHEVGTESVVQYDYERSAIIQFISDNSKLRKYTD